MKLVAVVGRSGPETGGEYYNVHALQGLSEVMGEPFVLEMDAAPSWIGWFNRPMTRYVYILAMNVWALVRLARESATHCYIDFFCYRYLWLFMLYACFSRPRLMVVVHGLYHVLMREGFRRGLVMSAERIFLSACSGIVTTSQDTAKRLSSELHVAGPPVTTIIPGIERVRVDAEQLPPQSDADSRAMRILYVGMVKRSKGILDLVKALGSLSSQGIEAELHIAGREDIEPDCTEEIRRVAGNGTVRFHGFLSQEALRCLYRESDIFVLPSHFETFGMVITEAMQMGLPVIATNCGGISETILHEQNGLLYTPGDVDELASQLRRLIESPEMRNRLRASALAASETFPDWRDVRESFRKLAAAFC